ncbi:DUF3883 domain-containing protein [Sphaerotilus mobilis]|uniref:Uncharacterized protein DUF3883 n=1 Tax=Sphaerotilus mobilis TaxID=47994 RepID=A0A4V2EVR1_9BURK|nr:DUF3883 domain-containing protein [Sphaerotilus mobilis]RZS53370.1 uncharacterized protein DUF3883 [Sphaerotilus mobilis]
MPAALSTLTRHAVLVALDEFQRLGRSTFLRTYGFGEARDYFVLHPVSGLACDSKAIVGVAHGIQFPDRGPLGPKDFSGGVATVAKLLRDLGFELSNASAGEPAVRSSNLARAWSREEVELLVADYLQMLTLELAGQTYNKAARRRALLPLLEGRSEASIEFKRRNVSAVMGQLGLPYVRGYLPAENTQAEMLISVVSQQMDLMPQLAAAADEAVERLAVEVEAVDHAHAKAAAPARQFRAAEPVTTYHRRAIRRDYLERETRNRSLGLAGEKFIVDHERWRLLKSGLGQLADRVEHKSVSEGDGLGYDVLSFESDGSERYIEVKTTAFSELTPFFVTANELDFARTEPDRFALCRVFDFRQGPRFFEVRGPVERHFHLDPATFRASLQ